jgi:uncharacterized protein with FMN-binding domain
MKPVIFLFSLFFPLLFSGLFFLGCAGTSGQRAMAPASPAALPDGEYEGSAEGCRGPIRVRVRMESGAIGEIVVLESRDDPAVGGAAMEELIELVIVYQSTDLDAISGATESSKGFLAAIENAILGQ